MLICLLVLWWSWTSYFSLWTLLGAYLSIIVCIGIPGPLKFNGYTQLHLFGHISWANPSDNHSCASYAVVSHLPAGWQSPRGSPRWSCFEWLKLTSNNNLGLSSTSRRAQDRSKWRCLVEIAMPCEGHATWWRRWLCRYFVLVWSLHYFSHRVCTTYLAVIANLYLNNYVN